MISKAEEGSVEVRMVVGVEEARGTSKFHFEAREGLQVHHDGCECSREVARALEWTRMHPNELECAICMKTWISGNGDQGHSGQSLLLL